MKQIKQLIGYIREEIECAEEYATEAMAYKDTDMELARAYHEIARQELVHAEKEHDLAVSYIKMSRDAGVEVPKGMMDVWEWEHEQLIKKMSGVREIIGAFKA